MTYHRRYMKGAKPYYYERRYTEVDISTGYTKVIEPKAEFENRVD